MAIVEIPSRLRHHVDGAVQIVVEARDVRALFRALEARAPELAEALRHAAVAIDGEIVQEPLLEPLEPGSEVQFLSRLSGG